MFLPFLAGGPRTEIGPFTVSSDGLWGAWNILAKGTLGVGATVLLTATTTVPDLIRGLERLRLPRQVVAIVMFMVRYGDVVAAEMHRMRVAQRVALPRSALDLAGARRRPIRRGAVRPLVRTR